MPLQATSGAASYDAFGGGVPSEPNYIESVFQTYLYTGNGSTQTITNGIDLSTKGGLVWIKGRTAANSNVLFDTARGANNRLISNLTNAQSTETDAVTSFNTNGFSIGASAVLNTSSNNIASWSFRKQPKFFDVVTYTGNGTSPRTISHNLGSAPGFIAVKPTSQSGSWWCYHRSLGAGKTVSLNATDAALTSNNFWGGVAPTSTEFTVQFNNNEAGVTYVAYLFAHDAGGFGLTGTDNVISCGSYTLDASGNADINLGYEPQWVLLKKTNGAAGWVMMDTMRGFSLGGDEGLLANSSNAAFTYGANVAYPTATGFSLRGWGASGSQEIYIAIRRGPMKVPTSGTSVFYTDATTASTGAVTTTNFPVDLQIGKWRTGSDAGQDWSFIDRLRGLNTIGAETYVPSLRSTNTNAESTSLLGFNFDNLGYKLGSYYNGLSKVFYSLRRAPSFFDEVCYTGTGSARTVTHNLGAVPELMLVKRRDAGASWVVYSSGIAVTDILTLQSTNAAGANTSVFNATAPTSSVFSVGTSTTSNGSGGTYVAYLFATCAGVSKCTAFTGTGSLQTINCGFTAGSRFVLIKRTDAAGDWYVWDSSRGLSSSTDPYLLLNSTAAEVTSTNWVDTTSTGFQVTAASGNNVNINGASYIALAIA